MKTNLVSEVWTIKRQNKKTAKSERLSSKEKVFFYYGGSKKLIMYWGFYSYYNSKCVDASVHNDSQILENKLCIIHMTKK